MEHRAYNIKTIFISFSFIIFLVSLDQISKYIIRHGGGFYICNPNIAFGIKMPELMFWFFWIGIIGIILLALIKVLKNVQSLTTNSRLSVLVLVLVLAGALSNMIDRMTLGCVIDFIDLRIWPVFNLADIYIFSGAVFGLARLRK